MVKSEMVKQAIISSSWIRLTILGEAKLPFKPQALGSVKLLHLSLKTLIVTCLTQSSVKVGLLGLG